MNRLIVKIAIPVAVCLIGEIGLILWRRKIKKMPWYRRIAVVPIVK